MTHRYDPTTLEQARKEEDFYEGIRQRNPCIYGEVIRKKSRLVKCSIFFCQRQLSDNTNKFCNWSRNIDNCIREHNKKEVRKGSEECPVFYEVYFFKACKLAN